MNSLVLLAAGSGTRLNLGYNKMLYEVNGLTLLELTLRKFQSSKLFEEIIVVVRDTELENWQTKNIENVTFVIGGNNRQESVYNGVNCVSGEYVWIHDGARCNISLDAIARLNKSIEYPGVALAVKAKDSLRIVINGEIKETLNRDEVYQMQTPQIVLRDAYLRCYDSAQVDGSLETDEVGLLYKYGYSMKIIDGEYSNLKITTREDLEAINERI